MKRIHLLILLFSGILLLGSFSVRASSVGELVTEMRVYDNDTTYRYDYFYDASGRKVLETKYYQSGNLWIRTTQTEWIYRDGNCVQQVERAFEQNAWRATFGIDYTYNQSVLSAETRYRFNRNQDTLYSSKTTFSDDNRYASQRWEFVFQSNRWINTQQHATSLRVAQVDTTWITFRDASGADTASYRYINTYSPQSVLLNQIQQEMDSAKWKNMELIKWYYKTDGSTLYSYRVKKWNAELKTWDNYQRIDYEYDNSGKLISESALYWYMMFWVSDFRYEYVLDTDGGVVQKNLAVPLYNDWRKLISIDYSGFENGNARKMESSFDFWGGTTGEKVSSFIPYQFNGETVIRKAKSIELRFSADTAQSVNDVKSSVPLKVFPNPSDGVFYIDSFNQTVFSWQVVDLSGRVVCTKNEQITTGVVDITGLPRGVYLLKAQTQAGVVSQKLIKN